MFVPVFAYVSPLIVHSSLDYPHVHLVPSAITPCTLNLLYLFLCAVLSQSSTENGYTHLHKYSLTVLRDGSLVFFVSAPALRHTVSMSPSTFFVVYNIPHFVFLLSSNDLQSRLLLPSVCQRFHIWQQQQLIEDQMMPICLRQS
jgi:hypothetical protein